ncbi:hypothetical protein [Puia dinghuensis]|uniref:Uncharacterized protein n=1 Tax=Puia dinghuensis TaxID=1792502 RepID=A0A8J2UF14_9BACT|nr:hypothetical protein [Puia dinghuensis]GGB08699.1 hypothetical protein GCM10011511_35230 [Puia dinghuensis]
MEPPSWSARFSRLRQLFWFFFLLTIGYMIWVRSYLAPLNSDEIVQFEIAKTAGKAQAIIDNWKQTGKYEQGVKSTYFAYIFMVLYTLAIALGCLFISACTGNEIMIKGGKGFAWLIILATACDVIENISLAHTIRGPVSQWNVTVAYNLARVKFSIVIVCILFMLVCALYWVISRLAGEKS